MKITLISLLIIMSSCNSISQDFGGRTVVGKQYAMQEIKKALSNKNATTFYDTLIKDQEIAIAMAEPILFRIYGKPNIIEERPYECYMIDGYWYISGTLPKGWTGGVFEIIIRSKDACVIKLIHGK
jgi:hypothetical protein